MRHARHFEPMQNRRRAPIVLLVLLFAGFSTFSFAVSRRAIERSSHRATLVRTISRQRTLATKYASEVMLQREGRAADPAATARVITQSARALVDGGLAPAVEGDDDEVMVARATSPRLRGQLQQAQRLVHDLVTTGRYLLDDRAPLPHLTANEALTTRDPVQRLRVLSALTTNVVLNASRTAANETDRNLADLQHMQAGLAFASAALAAFVGWALIETTRRRNAHFRSLVTQSSDLVIVHSRGEVVYASAPVVDLLGHEAASLRTALADLVHPDDRAAFADATDARTTEVVVRVRAHDGEWRHLDLRVSDLRDDRHVRGVVFNGRDISERVRLEEELSHQAFHDTLTGLANRALFRDRLEQAIARAARHREPFSVLLFDLDGFKQVNDTLGHAAGDELLRAAAARLGSVTRPTDTLARLGGDEFAVLLEGADEPGAIQVAERMRDELGAPLSLEQRSIALTASIGIVVHHGNDDGEALMRHADVAMYSAKSHGRGHHAVFRDEMADDLAEVVALEHDLQLALARGEFSVHYQPTVDITTRVVTGAEALVRWNPTSRAPVGPDVFIPIAEANGVIHDLGAFVLREATRQVAQWDADGLLSDRFAVWVNVSGEQLSAGDLREIVAGALDAAGTTPQRLGLEITENAIVDDGPTGARALEELQTLHDLGVRIALDDFGTGFSSLAHLHRLPIDVIKVDRSFVNDVERDSKNAAITGNLAALAKSLGLVSVAEGIETEVQLAMVQRLGCDIAQGYLLARPAPAPVITQFLASQPRVASRESA